MYHRHVINTYSYSHEVALSGVLVLGHFYCLGASSYDVAHLLDRKNKNQWSKSKINTIVLFGVTQKQIFQIFGYSGIVKIKTYGEVV